MYYSLICVLVAVIESARQCKHDQQMAVTYAFVLQSASDDNLLSPRAVTREKVLSDLTLLSTGDVLTQGYTDGVLGRTWDV